MGRVVVRVPGDPGTWDHAPVGAQQVNADSIDFAVAVFREEGRWSVSSLPARLATSPQSLLMALRQLPGEGGVFGFVGIGDECFVALREIAGHARGFVSDAAAVYDWSLADELADELEWDVDDEDDLDEVEPVGDLAIFADFGLDADEVALVCQDDELYPDEQVRSIAKRLGFGVELATALRAR